MSAITGPGVYDGVPLADYHRHESLSSSGARALLPPSCPALYRYERDHGRAPKRAFDLGTAAHTMLLGDGAEIVEIHADNYYDKKAAKARDEAYDAGKTPLLPRELDAVMGMVKAVRDDPDAGPWFAHPERVVEQTLVWEDEATGVLCRARPDLRIAHVAVDLKTCAADDEASIEKSNYNFGYRQQDDFYRRGMRVALGIDEPELVFVFVEKTPPHLIVINRIPNDVRARAAQRNAQAMAIYRECTETGTWPGRRRPGEIANLGIPAWAEKIEEYQ